MQTRVPGSVKIVVDSQNGLAMRVVDYQGVTHYGAISTVGVIFNRPDLVPEDLRMLADILALSVDLTDEDA